MTEPNVKPERIRPPLVDLYVRDVPSNVVDRVEAIARIESGVTSRAAAIRWALLKVFHLYEEINPNA
jgi:hypothetical protein